MVQYVLSLSGGEASAATAVYMHRNLYDFRMVFADTTIEDEDLYRYLYDLQRYIGQEIIYLRDGRDPFEVFVDTSMMGNNRIAKCSEILKTEQVRKFIKTHEPNTTMVLGLYADESDRLERARRNWHIPVCSVLLDQGISFSDADLIMRSTGIKRPGLYGMGFPHNNCGGFCVRAGQSQFATLLARKPATYAKMEMRNEWAEKRITAKTTSTAQQGFIRVTMEGHTDWLSMREFREYIEKGYLQPALFEPSDPCNCFIGD